MITLLSTWTFGLALGFVALGVYVSYKLFSFPDITTDGSFTLGAVVTAVLLSAGADPVVATAGGMAAGALAGTTTVILHAVLGVEPLLAGILVTTALASVNLVVLGRSNVPLTGMTTLFDRASAALGPAVAAVTGCDHRRRYHEREPALLHQRIRRDAQVVAPFCIGSREANDMLFGSCLP